MRGGAVHQHPIRLPAGQLDRRPHQIARSLARRLARRVLERDTRHDEVLVGQVGEKACRVRVSELGRLRPVGLPRPVAGEHRRPNAAVVELNGAFAQVEARHVRVGERQPDDDRPRRRRRRDDRLAEAKPLVDGQACTVDVEEFVRVRRVKRAMRPQQCVVVGERLVQAVRALGPLVAGGLDDCAQIAKARLADGDELAVAERLDAVREGGDAARSRRQLGE